ncbi:MAG: hypothetical protein COW24_05310 [Candidatus Kerfeldbacteria bacterium CG15_BIG_FIL_POST_REV_8_21_14_020_45_12]|uniref:Glutamate--cysteine ligase n=1 Tax=Candidatus Kerfeldbacteria bacterium CG15_BIG_FIL_POST_REV_8_21_14_020_45_12 TaxID=2014247 RepID=A0A2M7H2J1_9BACT|nr:MAG: hypothetical protein COW24_05310 [Candidatus Kerfeldbacteria bacterium CG15_BIG_FIL_POST_REV_8_21_14_020_45_12]PJA93481.1 MAG: hypothetical protein CO132_02525 [Candidatus Kerfeldbacteria bacterium CG_4_9_14_3_um_filter_45_8]
MRRTFEHINIPDVKTKGNVTVAFTGQTNPADLGPEDVPLTVGYEREPWAFRQGDGMWTPVSMDRVIGDSRLTGVASGELFDCTAERKSMGPISGLDDLLTTLVSTEHLVRGVRDDVLGGGVMELWDSVPPVPCALAMNFGHDFIRHCMTGYGWGDLTFYESGGSQVHIGINDGPFAAYVFNLYVRVAPMLRALTLNSPFYRGQFMGLASVRNKLRKTLGNSGVIPEILHDSDPFRNFEGELREVQEAMASGAITSLRGRWNATSLRMRLATIEFSEPDNCGIMDLVLYAGLMQLFTARLMPVYRGEEELPSFLALRPSEFKLNYNHREVDRYGTKGKLWWRHGDDWQLVETRVAWAEFMDWLMEASDLVPAHTFDLNDLLADRLTVGSIGEQKIREFAALQCQGCVIDATAAAAELGLRSSGRLKCHQACNQMRPGAVAEAIDQVVLNFHGYAEEELARFTPGQLQAAAR